MNEPFTTADKLQAQRLQQHLAAARKARDDGEIDDRAHGELVGLIQQRLAPLLQRQQQADQQAKQQQQQDLARQHAQLQAMEQQAAVYRANNLHDRIVRVRHPVTGKVALMMEKAPNKWEEVDFSQADAGGEQRATTPSEGE